MTVEIKDNTLINWDQFKYTDFKINSKTGKKYFQQYIIPSYYLELFFISIDEIEIINFFNYFISKMGNHLKFHHNNSTARESKFKDSIIAFEKFRESMKTKKYVWYFFSKNAGVGSEKDVGGASDCSFSCWFHKTTKEKADRSILDYKKKLIQNNSAMLKMGIKVSSINISIPLNSFNNHEEFKNWVLNSNLVNSGLFLSGTSGYKINYWNGYSNKIAKEKLKKILKTAPGFDFDVASSMGRFISADSLSILPTIKRPNWLNFISEQGIDILGGYDKIKKRLSATNKSEIINLKKGKCIQACPTPALFEGEDLIKQYFQIGQILSKLNYKPHPSDYYYEPDNESAKNWRYKFSDSNFE